MSFLENLKAGDKVIVESIIPCSDIFPTVSNVVRCTKDLVVVEINGQKTRFNKATRRMYGVSVFDSCYLKQASPERIAEVEQNNRRKELKNLIEDFVSRGRLNQVTDKALEAVVKLLGIDEGREK